MQTSVKSFQLMFLILSRSWQISKEKRLDRPVGQVIASTYFTNMVLFKKSKQEMLQLVNVDHFLLGAVGAYKTWNGSLSWLVGLLSFSSCCDLLGPYCRKTWYDNQHCTVHDMPLVTYNTTITKGCEKHLWYCFLQENSVEFGSAQSRHHMVDTENEFDGNGRYSGTVITGRTTQRSKYNEEKTDDRVLGTCVRLSSCPHHLIKDIRSGTIWTSGGVTWSYGPMAGLPLSSLCHLIGGYLVNF